jgi:superfamily I DNA and RNA helicase
LSFTIWPESKIEIPIRPEPGKERFQKEVKLLDQEQARLALRLRSGHQIIKGPPGSGKTLVLVHRCVYLKKYNPKVKRILIVCFNITLVSYLKRLVIEKGIGVGDGGVHIHHFYDLCATVLGRTVHYEKEDNEYYEVVELETSDKINGDDCDLESFDAILIDEGQDFSEDMFVILLKMLKPGGDLVVSLDSYQDLYRRRASWKSLGIKASGRTRHLRKVYRNTAVDFLIK